MGIMLTVRVLLKMLFLQWKCKMFYQRFIKRIKNYDSLKHLNNFVWKSILSSSFQIKKPKKHKGNTANCTISSHNRNTKSIFSLKNVPFKFKNFLTTTNQRKQHKLLTELTLTRNRVEKRRIKSCNSLSICSHLIT